MSERGTMTETASAEHDVREVEIVGTGERYLLNVIRYEPERDQEGNHTGRVVAMLTASRVET